MKLAKLLKFSVLAPTLAVALVGCQMGPQNTQRIPGARPKPTDENMNPPPGLSMRNRSNISTEAPITPPNSNDTHIGYREDTEALKPETIYFDLDKSAIKPSQQSKLDEVVNFLKGNPAKAVRVEGNCDERGTEEYNRSLGERRALAAREYLIQSGISPQRVDTLTNGEDKPAVQGHNEAAWSKNRRDEFIVLSPPGQ